jgi:hypothetical protein
LAEATVEPVEVGVGAAAAGMGVEVATLCCIRASNDCGRPSWLITSDGERSLEGTVGSDELDDGDCSGDIELLAAAPPGLGCEEPEGL